MKAQICYPDFNVYKEHNLSRMKFQLLNAFFEQFKISFVSISISCMQLDLVFIDENIHFISLSLSQKICILTYMVSKNLSVSLSATRLEKQHNLFLKA